MSISKDVEGKNSQYTNDAQKNLKYELITIVFEDDHMEEIKAIFGP